MSQVDLRQLAVRRDGQPALAAHRPWWTRYALPALLLLGFAALALWAARDLWVSARPVTVLPVLSTRAAGNVEGTALFQTAGWVEPRPTAILVTALAEGVLEKLFVVEGQTVKAGQKVAQLIAADAELALRHSQAEAELRQAEVDSAQAAVTAAQMNLDKPGHLQAALGEAEAMLAQKETELGSLPFLITSARARAALARFDWDAKAKAGNALPMLQILQAKSEFDTAEAGLAELTAREARLKLEAAAQRGKRDALKQRLDLKVDERRVLAEAKAQLRATQARAKLAQVALETAQLRLDRTTVVAPVSGQVLALVGRPGTRLMGLAGGSHQDSGTVITMYDPAQLQVRADVRLEDVPRVLPGQKVRIETPAAPAGPLTGTVLAVTSQADIQKNTLQVKVALHDPPPTVRPDMLVQVTFQGTAAAKEQDSPTQLRLLIPRSLIMTGGGGPRVLIADQASKVARVRTVKLGLTTGDLVEILDGLQPTDRLIAGGRDGLKDGDRITITGEEAGIPVPGSKQQRSHQHGPG